MNLTFNKFNLIIHLIISAIFFILNPLYGLFLTTLISLFTKKISFLLVSSLYVLSFSLIFANQVYEVNSDLGSYIATYKGVEADYMTIGYITKVFFTIQSNHKEILWFLYCMLVGELSNYSENIFVLTTYFVIFSLSAILAYLVSDRGRYNPILILFSLIFVELALLLHGYYQWRIIIGSFVFLIGLIIYDPDKNKLISRIFVYAAGFFHMGLFIYILPFELFTLLIYRKNLILNNRYYYLRILLLTSFAVIFLINIQPLLIYFIENIPATKNAFKIYLNPETMSFEMNNNKIFNPRIYLNLMYLMVITYIFFNFRFLKSYEIFGIMAFIVLQIIQITNNSLDILYTRASLVPHFLFILISTKALYSIAYFKGFNKSVSAYIFCFVCLIFLVRIYKFTFEGLYFPLDKIALGGFISPNYGLIYSLIHYEPIFF